MNKDRFEIFRQLIKPAYLGYLLVWGSGLVAYFFLMSSRASDIMALIAIFLAIPGVLLRWGASPIFFVLLTTYGIIDPGFFSILNFLGSGKWYALAPNSGFNIEDMMLGASILAYLIGHYRLYSMLSSVIPNEPSIRREVEITDPKTRPETQVDQDELPRTLMIAGCCIVAAQAIWMLLGYIERITRPHAYMPAGTKTLFLLWGVGSLAMILAAALTYLRMSRMSEHEATMVLRDASFQENRRETDRVERWRKWFKNKMSRKRAGR